MQNAPEVQSQNNDTSSITGDTRSALQADYLSQSSKQSTLDWKNIISGDSTTSSILPALTIEKGSHADSSKPASKESQNVATQEKISTSTVNNTKPDGMTLPQEKATPASIINTKQEQSKLPQDKSSDLPPAGDIKRGNDKNMKDLNRPVNSRDSSNPSSIEKRLDGSRLRESEKTFNSRQMENQPKEKPVTQGKALWF